MRTIIVAVAVAMLSSSAFAAPALDAKGVCRDHGKFATGCAAKPAMASSAPHCSKGKPCGNSCIAKDKVCHK